MAAKTVIGGRTKAARVMQDVDPGTEWLLLSHEAQLVLPAGAAAASH